MGIELVKAVAAQYGDLPGSQYKVLMYMALTALDQRNGKGQPARVYFAGWEKLVTAIGHQLEPDGGSRRRRDQYEMVRRALAALEARGAIERSIEHPKRGTRQSYRLLVSPAPAAGLGDQEPLQSSGANDTTDEAADSEVSPAETSALAPLDRRHKPRCFVGISPAKTAGPRKIEEEEKDKSEDVTAGAVTRPTSDLVLAPSTTPAPRSNASASSSSLAIVERPDVDRICEHLADQIEANGSKRPAITQKWRTEARLMLDKDGRAEEDVHRAIRWCQADPFWKANILSLPKLRDKYDQLRLQAQRGQATRSRTQEATDDLFAAALRRAQLRDGNLS